MKLFMLIAAVAMLAFAISSCGTTTGERAASGGLLGAGAGAVIGAATGSTVTGAVIGGVAGAATGALTDPCSVNLGTRPANCR